MEGDAVNFALHGLGEALDGAVWGDNDMAAARLPQHIHDRCGDIPAGDQEEGVPSTEDPEAGRDI